MKTVLKVILGVVIGAIVVALILYAFKLGGFIKSSWTDLKAWFEKLQFWK